MAKKKRESNKPTGLGIVRTRGKITCHWKNYSYETQSMQWETKVGNKVVKKTPSISAGASEKSFSLKASDYCPYNKKPILDSARFRVKGRTKDDDKYNYTMSDWSKWESINFVKPVNPPKISISLGGAYSPVFYVNIADHSSRKEMWETTVQYQSCLVLDSGYTKGADIPEQDWTGDSPGVYGEEPQLWPIWDSVYSQVRTEFNTGERYWADSESGRIAAISAAIVNDKNPVRWFRARVCGPGGRGSWEYGHISYSKPNEVSHPKATLTKNSSIDGYDVSVDFDIAYSASQPVDNIKIEYSISVPNSDLTMSAQNWTPADIGGGGLLALREVNSIPKDSKSKYDILQNYYKNTPVSGVLFQIAGPIPNDNLIYIRVNTEYNGKVTYGTPFLATNLRGEIINKTTVLNPPTDVSIQPDETNGWITVTATNQCAVPGVFLTVNLITIYPRPQIKTKQYIPVHESARTIGIIIPSGTGNASIANIEVPASLFDEDASAYDISVQAVAGSYDSPSRLDGQYNVYTVTKKLSSIEIRKGSLPRTPTITGLENLMDGNVRVSFDWVWEDAKSAEIAWSDYELILESNETPSSYIMSDTKRASAVIRGLTPGMTWYFWVRYINNDYATGWSEVASIGLSSAPNTPYLSASKQFVTMDENDSVNLTWAYVSTDGTGQDSAKLAQIISPGDDIVEILKADGESTSYEVGSTISTVKSLTIAGESATCTTNGKIFTLSSAPEQGVEIVVTYTSSETYYKIIARVPNDIQQKTDQYITLYPQDPDLGWETGKTYSLALKVKSESGLESEDWSNTVQIMVPEPIECSISEVTNFYELEDDDMASMALGALPFTVSVDGPEDMTRTSLYIERFDNYFIDRPDGGIYGGYAGEVVVSLEQEGAGVFEIFQEDVRGYLDDGAYYTLTAIVTDNYGQTAEDSFNFVVDWDHQAIVPEVEMRVNTEERLAFIKILEPETDDWETYTYTEVEEPIDEDLEYYYERAGESEPYTFEPTTDTEVDPTKTYYTEYYQTDVCDIYRHSVDGYELVLAGAAFGSTYVDPYPTLGEHGGHRIVYRTYNGDYITDTNGPAWLDVYPENGDLFESNSHIVNFGNDTYDNFLNADLDSQFNKDFQITRYLGGSIEGDWNSGVEMTGSIKTNMVTMNIEEIEILHRLAGHEGPCRIRTTNGANYIANVNVSESIPYQPYNSPTGETTKLASYTMDITRVDSPTTTLIPLGASDEATDILFQGYTMTDWYNATPIILKNHTIDALLMPDDRIATLVQPEGE